MLQPAFGLIDSLRSGLGFDSGAPRFLSRLVCDLGNLLQARLGFDHRLFGFLRVQRGFLERVLCLQCRALRGNEFASRFLLRVSRRLQLLLFLLLPDLLVVD